MMAVLKNPPKAKNRYKMAKLMLPRAPKSETAVCVLLLLCPLLSRLERSGNVDPAIRDKLARVLEAAEIN